MNDLVFKKLKSNQQCRFNLYRSLQNIKELTNNVLPSDGEIYKFISLTGGLSSISFIKWVSNCEVIEELNASTLRVGRSQLQDMITMHNLKKLKNARFFVGSLQKQGDGVKINKYNYFSDVEAVCSKNKWKLIVINNHSKIILMRTTKNYYVLETSSNLNENPKIEQYSFTNNRELYDFYYAFFDELEKKAGDNNG